MQCVGRFRQPRVFRDPTPALLQMNSSTQIHKTLLAAAFTDQQARGLVTMLQQLGTVEPGEIGGELERFERLLEAEPFTPSEIELSGGLRFRVQERGAGGFTRHGSLWVRQDGKLHVLSGEHITRVGPPR